MSHIIEPQQPATSAIIWMHGLGADCFDFVDIVPQLQLPSTRFIFPNAPVRPITINYSMPCRAWYDIYQLDRIDKEDEAGMRQSQQSINALIEEQQQQGIASNKITLAGFSQGGVMALFAGLRYPKSLAAIVALSCYLPLRHTLGKESHASNQQTPIFLAHGSQDQVVPFQAGQNARQQLTQHGYQVEWHEYPMAHQMTLSEIADLSHFLQHAALC